MKYLFFNEFLGYRRSGGRAFRYNLFETKRISTAIPNPDYLYLHYDGSPKAISHEKII